MGQILAIILFLIFFHCLFFEKLSSSFSAGSLGFAVFFTGFNFFLILGFSKRIFRQKHGEGLVFSFLAIFLSWLATFRGDRAFVGRILSWASVGFTFLAINDYVQTTPKLYSFFQIIFLPFSLGKAFLSALFYQKDRLRQKIKKENHWLKFSLSIFSGLLIAFPFVAILLLLFNQADPIFAKFFKDFWRGGFSVFLKRLGVTFAWLFLLLPLLNMKIEEKISFPKRGRKENKRWLLEIGVVVGLTIIVLGWFLGVQFRYLFFPVEETKLIQYGVKTYSEYVSRGFMELIFASFIVYVLVRTSLLFGRLKLNLLLLTELTLLIISVFRRLFLYQFYHGLTVARIFGAVFLFWLVAMVVILILRHYSNKKWLLFEIGTTAIFLIFLGLFNVENAVVLYAPPKVNNEVDEIYLASLSPDGYLGWQKAYIWAENQTILLKDKKEISWDEARKLSYALTIVSLLKANYFSFSSSSSNWRQLNFSEQSTWLKMKKEIPKEKLETLYQELLDINDKIPGRIKEDIPFDRAPGRFFLR